MQSWSLDIQTETVKGWGMGEAWTTSETLMQSWSGNVECYLDPEDDGQNALIPGAIVAIEFYPHDDRRGRDLLLGQRDHFRPADFVPERRFRLDHLQL